MQHPELPLFAFLSAFLVLLSLIHHWNSQNVAILAMFFWLSLATIINGVNAIVWAGNMNNPIHLWCDITTKVLIGASYAVPSATLCICKHLAMFSTSRKISYDAKDRKLRIIFEGLACFVVPICFMVLHYIVQDHRYDIVENTGCQAAIYMSTQAILIIWLPRLLLCAITLIYASIALHNFVRRRLTFAAHLQNSNSMLTTNRYFRLIAMALTETVWLVAVTSYSLSTNVGSGLRPWKSWANVHSDFTRVAVFSIQDLPPHSVKDIVLSSWMFPVSGLIFVAFFASGEEAVQEYKRIWTWFRSAILRRRSLEKSKAPFKIHSTNRRGLKPLHLISLKTTSSFCSSNISSPSRDYSAKSPPTLNSHLSQSSTTSIISPSAYYEGKKAKTRSTQDIVHIPEPAPSYYPPDAAHHLDLGIPIAPRRISPPPTVSSTPVPRSPSLPDLEDCDTFTLSTFSYYGGALSSPMAGSLTSPSLSMFAPEPPSVVEPASLPPPPRRGPRHMGSNGSVNSAATAVPGVPEDIGPASYERRRILGISGGAIFITVEREELRDAHA